MKRSLLSLLALVLVACAAPVEKGGTIAELRDKRVEIKNVQIEGGFEKAMESYQRFLQETPDSPLVPEAIRRLADLKVEKEYGHLTGGIRVAGQEEVETTLPAPKAPPVFAASDQESALAPVDKQESEADAEFEKRASSSEPLVDTTVEEDDRIAAGDDLERAGALEAIALYQKLLNEYPLYERNDQVLYQMSRAYEELGRIEEAMQVMDRLVHDYPSSRYLDEIQFRRAEYFFIHRRYLDAEDSYKGIVDIGVGSFYFPLALYKLGWTFYKQELYSEALDNFVALLDHKVTEGYDFTQAEDETERKRMEDTFRVISLSFSNIGGADAVVDYFSRHGKRSYEYLVYSNLAEYYYDKRRYSDATATYNAFMSRNPYHGKSPNFHMRVIEINIAGGFPTLVIDSKKSFASIYGLNAEYWQHFEPDARPEVLEFLKANLVDLANHYHALYQDKKRADEKTANFAEALHWYREYLSSFPRDIGSPVINYQLASLFLENRSFADAAVEYEKTAYDYPRHEKSSEAGYAAVYAYRQHLDSKPGDKDRVKREVVRISLMFADTYPENDKAAIVLGAAADDLDDMEDYEQARAAATKLIEEFPGADKDILRGAWLVVAHSAYELLLYHEAEAGYVKVLELLPEGDKSRSTLVDNLAISIYKQGEQAKASEDFRVAADHFLRVGDMAPTSKFRANAEYDAAAALIQLKDWQMAATVLSGFREQFPGHELQPEVTKKIAFVYQEDGRLSLAADEYERIERESQDEEVRRGALMIAAGLHEETGNKGRALEVYRRYVGYFPQPVEFNLESRNKIAEILKAQNQQDNYLAELGQIVAVEAAAGSERTPRTRYLAGKAALVLAEQIFGRFMEVKLVKPFEANLLRKKELMKTVTQQFTKLLDYEVGEVTAAATFYLAETYAHFSKALMESERPEGLDPLESEEYELAIEEQAYPFEERAIAVHESNLELIALGVYNEWIGKSLQKLAEFVPARYDKPEEESTVIASLDTYMFAIDRPESLEPPEAEAAVEESIQSVESTGAGEPGQTEVTAQSGETVEAGEPGQAEKAEQSGEEAEVEEPSQAEKAALTGGAAEAGELVQGESSPQGLEAAAAGEPILAAVPARAQEPSITDEAAPESEAMTGEGASQPLPDVVEKEAPTDGVVQ
jgi:tetratricopeptide (TPR) repeat protein